MNELGTIVTTLIGRLVTCLRNNDDEISHKWLEAARRAIAEVETESPSTEAALRMGALKALVGVYNVGTARAPMDRAIDFLRRRSLARKTVEELSRSWEPEMRVSFLQESLNEKRHNHLSLTIKELEEMGVVKKSKCPSDGRKSLVKLTRLGKVLSQHMRVMDVGKSASKKHSTRDLFIVKAKELPTAEVMMAAMVTSSQLIKEGFSSSNLGHALDVREFFEQKSSVKKVENNWVPRSYPAMPRSVSVCDPRDLLH